MIYGLCCPKKQNQLTERSRIWEKKDRSRKEKMDDGSFLILTQISQREFWCHLMKESRNFYFSQFITFFFNLSYVLF